jgi:H+/gluconate symporter-like permease
MAVFANLLGLLFLIAVAYCGFSVILFAPLAAMIPILLTHPSSVPTTFTDLYMERRCASSTVLRFFSSARSLDN